MDDAIFSVIIYVIVSLGLISLAWLRSGMRGITDELLKNLFRYLVALTVIAIVFSLWVLLSEVGKQRDTLTYRFVVSVSLVAIFALISRASLVVKRIGDTYGFEVGPKKR